MVVYRTGLPADSPLSLVLQKLRLKLGLGPHQDPLADFVLASGLDRYSREDVRTLTIGEICGNDRRLRVRVERRADFGILRQGAGSVFVGACELMRLSVDGIWSPILVVRDPFGDKGSRVADLVERYSVPTAVPRPR